MGLTWRDLVSSVTVVVMILAYASFEYGTSLVLLSSARAASGVELVPGSICAVCAAGDLHTRPQLRQGVIFRKVTTMLGDLCFSVDQRRRRRDRPERRLSVRTLALHQDPSTAVRPTRFA